MSLKPCDAQMEKDLELIDACIGTLGAGGGGWGLRLSGFIDSQSFSPSILFRSRFISVSLTFVAHPHPAEEEAITETNGSSEH